MSELINKTNTNTSEDYFDFLVCSGKPDGNDEVSICDCDKTSNTLNNNSTNSNQQIQPTPTPNKKGKRVAGAKDTPTSLYWYEETENFVPMTTLADLDELKKKIIKEYIRAKGEETRIEDKIDATITGVTSAITDVTSTIDNIEDVITNITEKVDSHTEDIDKIHHELHHEIHEREKLHHELHHALCHEKCAREHADKILAEKITETNTKIKETEEALMQYINDSTHSIHIDNDLDDDRKFNLFVGEEKISEFLVPYENLEKVSLHDNELTFTINVGHGEFKTLNVDLSTLVHNYSAGKGIIISDDNIISANINENNKFIKFNDEGKIDFNIGLTNNGNIWSYYLTDYNNQVVTDSMIDLNPIKDYIDNEINGAKEYTDTSIETLKEYTDESISSTTDTLKEYTDSQINALREEIDSKLDSMLIAGDNIKIITNEDGTKTISVKVDKDIHVFRDNLLIDNLPEGGDTLDQAIIKVLNNVVTNADTSDGEEILL